MHVCNNSKWNTAAENYKQNIIKAVLSSECYSWVFFSIFNVMQCDKSV